MITIQEEFSATEITMKFANTINNGECFFVQLGISFFNECKAYAIGHSVPAFKMCDNMVSMPKGEALQANTIGF